MKRLDVRKTYKLFLGGAFPRSESGRSYAPSGGAGILVPRGSRKDLRDAVVAARKAQPGWTGKTGYNRGQILYRVAEVLETRAESFAAEIGASSKASAAAARREVARAVDLITWYAGACDKVQSLLGSQNAVAGPFFNFSTVEASGVVGVVAPDVPSLLGLVGCIMPILVGGNTVVALSSESAPFPALSFAEVLAVSDVPGGVVNLLSGLKTELLSHFGAHRDIDSLLIAGRPREDLGKVAADSVKRVRYVGDAEKEWERGGSMLWVEPFVEVKTFWHPVAY